MKVKIQPVMDEEAVGEDRFAGLIIILCLIACVAASTLH